MRDIGYKNYAEFRQNRGSRVRRTEKAQLADLQSSIDQLTAQMDYESLDILRKIAAELAADHEHSTKEFSDQLSYEFTLDHITRADSRCRHFLAAFMAKQ